MQISLFSCRNVLTFNFFVLGINFDIFYAILTMVNFMKVYGFWRLIINFFTNTVGKIISFRPDGKS